MLNRTPTQKNRFIIGIGIFVFVALAAGLSTLIFSSQIIKADAKAKQIVGSVQKMNLEDGQISQIKLDQSILANQRILSQSNSFAIFELLKGEAILEIEPFTSVILSTDNSTDESILYIQLEVGQIRVRGGQGKVIVSTPTGTATPTSIDGALGIEVQADLNTTEFTCLQGFYQVTNQSGSVEITAGQSIEVASTFAVLTPATFESNMASAASLPTSHSKKALDQQIAEASALNNEPYIFIEDTTQETPTIPASTPTTVDIQPEEAVPTATLRTSTPSSDAVIPTEEPQSAETAQPVIEEPTITQPSTITDDNLNSESAATEPVLTHDARIELVEIDSETWKMIQYGDPSSLNIVPEGLNLTLKYDSDTKIVTGTTGCNSYRGEAVFQDNNVTVVVSPSAISKNACLENIMNYETLFHTMMAKMISYEINGDILSVTTSLGWVMIFQETISTTNSENIRPFVDSPPPEIPNTGYYYIDTAAGSDSNQGTQDAPWRTIQYAANALPENKTAIILEGHYPERVTITRPNLTFQAEGEVLMEGFSIQADYTTISGFTIMTLIDKVPAGIGIDVSNAGYCLIEDNRFLYNVWGGLRLDTDSHDCVVRDNLFFRNAMYAAEVIGQNHLIEGNDVSNTIQHHPCSSSTVSWLDADAFRFHGSGHIFRNNNIHDMPYGDAGYDEAACTYENLSDLSLDFVSDSHTDCFQTYDGDLGAGHDILFEGNRCDLPPASEWTAEGIGAKAIQGSGNAYNLTFRNNLIVADLLSLFYDGCHDISIVNNTFIGSGDVYSQGLKFENCAGNIEVKNNVFYNQGNGVGHIWQSDTPIDAGYNCVYVEDHSPSRPADPGDLWNVDPLLDADFRLTAASPCIDAGIDLGVSTDFDNRSRPQGDGFDIGAFEFPGQ